MKKVLILLTILAALTFTAVAFATEVPDDGQNPPEPVPGSIVQNPFPDAASVPQGTVHCSLTQYQPWHRYYSPWNQWYIQARTLVSCKESSGSIWLPYNAYSIEVRSRLYRAPEFLAYSLVDDRTSVAINDSIETSRVTYNCNGKLRNTKYQLRSTAYVDLDGYWWDEDPYEWSWDTFGTEPAYSCN